jgi:hypothetical protein
MGLVLQKHDVVGLKHAAASHKHGGTDGVLPVTCRCGDRVLHWAVHAYRVALVRIPLGESDTVEDQSAADMKDAIAVGRGGANGATTDRPPSGGDAHSDAGRDEPASGGSGVLSSNEVRIKENIGVGRESGAEGGCAAHRRDWQRR